MPRPTANPITTKYLSAAMKRAKVARLSAQPFSPATASAAATSSSTTSSPTPPSHPQPSPPCSQLLTKPQMISKLKSMVEQASLTDVAASYQIKPQQLSDILYGRANLSKKVLVKLRARMHEFYEMLDLKGVTR